MSNYWLDRAKREEAIAFNKSKSLIKDIQEVYKDAYKQLKSSIDSLEVSVRNNNMELDLLEANKLISRDERLELERNIKRSLKGYEELAKSIDYKNIKDVKEVYKFKSLQNMGYNSRISRLKAKQMEIEAVLTNLAKQQELMLAKHLEEVYEDTYYKTAYINALQSGEFETISRLDSATIVKAVKKSWLADGKNFSDRIWKNTAMLSRDIAKELTVNIAMGKGTRNLAEKISKRYNVTLSQASRLVQTETSAIRNQATLDRYKEDNIEQYQILAVLDSKTSAICQSMDLKIFNTKDQQIGVNCPPFHVNCRSTTAAYFEFLDDVKGTRKARLPNGEVIDVDNKLSYAEWKEKYIKSSPEQLKYEKMVKNKERDMVQYAKYKNILGKENMPKTFDSFQNMKYNEIDRWELLKYYKKAIQNNDLTRLVNFSDYENIKKSLEKELIGLKTKDNIEIKGISKHFIDRHIGAVFSKKKYSLGEYEMRKGVSLDKIKETLMNPIDVSSFKIDELGRKSKKYTSNSAQVSINVVTNELIQCNVKVKNKNKKMR